jgi:hypothetical protein
VKKSFLLITNLYAGLLRGRLSQLQSVPRRGSVAQPGQTLWQTAWLGEK